MVFFNGVRSSLACDAGSIMRSSIPFSCSKRSFFKSSYSTRIFDDLASVASGVGTGVCDVASELPIMGAYSPSNSVNNRS